LLVAVICGSSACSSTPPRTVGQANSAPVAAAESEGSVALIPAPAAEQFGRALAALEQERWREAEDVLELLVRDYPEFPGPYVNLAIVYRHDGRDADAEAALGQALAIAPEHPAANNQLGMLLRERGEFAAAESAYRRALAREPDYALAHYNLGVLLDLYLHRNDEALGHYERYQTSAAVPDAAVGLWIADLRRRLGMTPGAEQLAQEDGS
jgi:tetratricopeptide (TPR) repeat protein